jgi:hypothetical protein
MDQFQSLVQTHDPAPHVARTSLTANLDLLRRKVSQAEIDLYLEMLARLDWHAAFRFVLIVDASEEANDRALITLNSLYLQSYLEWRVVILRYRQLDSDVMIERLAKGLDDVRTLRDQLLNRGADDKAWRDRLLDGFDDLRDRVEVMSGDRSRRFLRSSTMFASRDRRSSLEY